jgi:hypothetical protein
MRGVSVGWAVTGGDGTVAGEGPSGCGAFASSASTVTSDTGKAGICWTMGLTPGANAVVATPQPGTGDIPAGATIIPAAITFNATANAPSALVFSQQPAAGSNITAGTNIPVQVLAVDHNGVVVLGSNDVISLGLNQYAFATGSTSATAVAGVATFTGLSISKAAAAYVMTASATFFGNPAAAAGNSFNVVAASAFGLSIVQGNNQTAPAGSVVPIAPTVQVTDAFGNAVGGASIAWNTGASTASSVSATPTTTGADGKTSTAWTIGGGLNQLVAALSRAALPDTTVVFEATGTETSVILDQCLPGTSGDPINDASKSFAFWLPNPGANKTYREIQLFFSSAGRANNPTPVQIQLTTQVGTFDPAVAPTNTAAITLLLRGSNSESKQGTFVLPAPIVGAGGGPKVMVRLKVLSNPDGATINFNTGACSPGNNCKVPQSCSVTEVSPLTPYPSGTPYRKSVGVTVRGS